MHLLVPGNTKQLGKRVFWFKNQAARELAHKKGVDFGFELKGEPETVTETPPLFWGYHLPNYYLTQWYYHPEQQEELLRRLKPIVKLAPAYLNIHGAHLWWQPDPKEKQERYLNRSDSDSYLKVLDANIVFLTEIKKIFPQTRILLENYPLYNLYLDDNNEYLPETYLYTGSGRLNDLLYLREKTGVEILLDIEHLILTLNFLNRVKNYHQIPVKKIEGLELTAITKTLYQIFGFYIKEDYYPYVDKPITYEEMVKKIGAKFYHLSGSDQDVANDRVVTHGPINLGDEDFLARLKPVLDQRPEVLVLETADKKTNRCYNYLRTNETELSFQNLCRILSQLL